jgi:cyclophilin family peptidyl-prolyl cis-trans isomerase
MTRWMWIAGLALFCAVGMAFAEEGETVENPIVVVTTSMGEIVIELDPEKAPITVENFLQYVDDEHYDGTIFHRVIKKFMIQGGGFDAEMIQKSNRDPIKNEATNGLTNEFGTIAMARTGVIDSATSQFFINTKNNTFLNHTRPDTKGYGYCVFGKVIEGMDVVMKIDAVTTGPGPRGRMPTDVPIETIMIESVRRK